MFLPIAAVLALQVWLSMTDRFDSEVARAAAVVPSFLVLCILGGDETTVTEPQLGAAEPPQQGSWWDSAWGGDGAGGAPQPLSAARAPSVGARAGREGVGAWQFAGFALSWSWEPARQLGNRLWVAALSAWGWLLAAWPTSFNREHAVLLAALALWYAWRVHARRLAPTLLREALEELIAQDEEVRRAAGECARESERSYPSPSRGLFRRGSPSPEQRVEANPRKMHMHCAEGCENCLLRAAEAPEGRWPMTRAESREQLTAAALRYRQAERQLVRLCRRLNSFSQIGLDRWPSGRRRMAEVAQDCAVICMRAKSFDAASSEGGLSERSAEVLRRLIRENDSRLRAMWEAMDSDGDGRLTELEIRSHNSQVRPVGMRRYRHHSDEEGAEGPQDWLLGVVWVVLLTLTPGDEFSQAPYACRALSEQYELPAEWFRRLVDIRRDQMQDAALQAADERWPRLLRRAPRGTGWLLLCGESPLRLGLVSVGHAGSDLALFCTGVGAFFALPRLTGGLWRAACAWLWRWASATSLAFRLGLALLGCAAICEVLILLSDLTGLAPWTLLPAGLLPRGSIPGAFWRYKRRKECRAWCKRRFRKPPRPAFRVEEEGEVEEQEEEPAMDSAGRVIYKRFAVSTHPGWWRCVPADGAPAFYLRESTGQREWNLPAPDASDEEEDAMGWSPGRGGGPGTPPPSASYDMHVGVSGRAPRVRGLDDFSSSCEPWLRFLTRRRLGDRAKRGTSGSRRRTRAAAMRRWHWTRRLG